LTIDFRCARMRHMRNVNMVNPRADPIFRSFRRRPESRGHGTRSRPAPGRTGISMARRAFAVMPGHVPGIHESTRNRSPACAEMTSSGENLFICPLSMIETKQNREFVNNFNDLTFAPGNRQLSAESAQDMHGLYKSKQFGISFDMPRSLPAASRRHARRHVPRRADGRPRHGLNRGIVAERRRRIPFMPSSIFSHVRGSAACRR